MVEHLEVAGLFLTEQQHNERVDEQYDCSHLIQFNGEAIGTLKYKIWGSHIEIMQLQIHPNHQNKGYGRGVIEQVIMFGIILPATGWWFSFFAISAIWSLVAGAFST